MGDESLRKTPLYAEHVKCGGKMVPFAGWILPVQYGTGVIAEHMAVRTKCGLFDVSHMGEIFLKGKDALKNLNHLLTNDYTNLKDGQARYSPMCNEEGGVVDDLIVYKIRDELYFIVVNAANKDKDFSWMKAHAVGDAELEDASDRFAQLALQGPKAAEILARIAAPEDIPDKYYTCRFDRFIQDIPCHISRTGYTGEDGVEIYVAPEYAPKLWNLLLETGKEDGLIPCGLGARDTLRMEAAMPLYGHEMDDTVSPKEAGLGIFVKMDKEEFVGKEAIEAKGKITRRRVGLRVTGKGIVREHETVYADGKQIGMTTSGTYAPFLKRPIAMALIDVAYKEPGTAMEADVRGRRVTVEVEPLPFYKR